VNAVQRLINKKQNEAFEIFNIGTGKGSSVLEVIQTFEKVNHIAVPHTIGPRRSGDIIQVWAETTKVENVLGWKAKRDLSEMLKDAWNWQKTLN
jgi:UDP-glucose 4-epimerase